jgi:hypothetical protein
VGSEPAGLLASGSFSSRRLPASSDAVACRGASRRRSQWRGPRRHHTGFPFTDSEEIGKELLRSLSCAAAKRKRQDLSAGLARKRQTGVSGLLAQLAANFAKLWSARGKATALGGTGDGTDRADAASITRCVSSRSTALPKRWLDRHRTPKCCARKWRAPTCSPQSQRHAHRSASSSAVALSVFSSRYFTITGVYTCSACSSANSPFIGREPGITTAPYGISSRRSAVRR